MPSYKGTLLINSTVGTPSTGFSESFAFTASSDAQAISEVQAWPTRRAQFLSNSFTVVGYRLASISQSVRGTPPTCKLKLTSIQIDACVSPQVGMLSAQNSPYDAALIRMFRQDKGKAREFEARGCPDTWFTNGALTIPIFEQAKIQTWFLQMQTGGNFGHYVLVKGSCTSPGVTPFTSFCIQRLASRRIGRPFGLLRGRRTK